MMVIMGGSSLHNDFSSVSCLDCGVVLLNLVDFPVNTGGKGIAHLADCFLSLKLDFTLTFWLLDLIFEAQPRCCLAFCIVENTLFFEDFSRREGFTSSVQTLMTFASAGTMITAF